MADRVLIATPSAKTVEERYAFSLFGLAKYETAKGHDVDLTIERGPYIHHNRNKFVREFLAGDWQWLLQIDMDILFQCDVLEKLLARKKDIVFGMYVRLNNGRPLSTLCRLKPNGLYSSIGEFGGGLIEVDGAGTGLCLTHRRVFEAIKKQRPDDYNTWFDFDPAPDGIYSEDFTFCRRVKETGFRLWGDCDIPTGHTKDMLLNNRIINKNGGNDASQEIN